MAFKSFTVKQGRLRLYDGTATPFFLEVPFRGTVVGPIDRGRPDENLILDRGRITPDAHYVQGSDEAILRPLPITLTFRMANTEPNRTKFLTLIRSRGGTTTKTVGTRAWVTTKATSQVRNADPEGTALHTTPAFIDPEKHCVDVELLYSDPDAAADQGLRWNEVYLRPDASLREGDQDVSIELNGEVYGPVATITAFTTGTES